MDEVFGTFKNILGSENDYIETYITELEANYRFHSKGSEGIVQHISSALSKPHTCREGLVLLNCYMKQAELDVLEQKATLWISLILRALNSKENEVVADLAYSALSLLTSNSLRLPEVSKSFLNNHLGKIYESLSKVSPSACLVALKCSEECLRSYPGPSGPFRSFVEKFLIKFIDAPTEDLSIWSGKCMHLLQQVRGGGVQGISHKASWLSYQQKLLGSLHSVLDLAFSNCNEIYEKPLTSNQDCGFLDLKLSDEPAKRAVQLFIRFRNLVNYLIVALRNPFPVAKSVAPKKLLHLISRGLSVTVPILEINPISDNLALGIFLPKIHILLLELLQTLILALRTNLKPHHGIILGLAVDTLNWTSGISSCGKKPLSNLRSKAYEILSLWCTILQNGSRIELFAETLITEVLYDTVPFQNECTLKVLNGAKKHMSKKARRQLHKAQNENSNILQSFTHDNLPKKEKDSFTDERDKKICVSALKALQKLLISATSFLKPSLLKMIHVRIMQICSLFYELPMKQEQLYFDWECRLEIFKVLHTFTINTHHLCPPPTQMTIHILQNGQMNDRNPNVRQECADLLRQMEKIIHPRKEGLIFPADIREIRNTFIKLGQERMLTSEAPCAGFSELFCHNDVELSIEISKENNNKTASLMNLTEKDINKDQECVESSLEPDSSRDSVKIVANRQSNAMNDEENMDFSLQSKFTLRVEDDDTEIIEKKQSSLEFTSEDRTNDTLQEPLPKKQKLEIQEKPKEPLLQSEPDNSLNMEVGAESKDAILTAKTDEDMLADIEAAFVNELN